jgi:hypothetical protein
VKIVKICPFRFLKTIQVVRMNKNKQKSEKSPSNCKIVFCENGKAIESEKLEKFALKNRRTDANGPILTILRIAIFCCRLARMVAQARRQYIHTASMQN